ncbi:MAG: hypothetical protein EZS28_050779, partial [Streblomastix strix]
MIFVFLLYSLLNAQDSDCTEAESVQLPCKCVNISEPVGCTCTGSNHPTDCTCPEDPAELLDIPTNNCPCLNAMDPRAGDECPAFCTSKAQLTPECNCEVQSSSYQQLQCEQDKLCLFDLISQDKSDCECLPTGDPRAGNECPAYCIAYETPTPNCVCDSNPNSQYSLQTCQSAKCPLIVSDNATIPQDCIEQTKKCSNAQLQDLIGIPV